MKKILLALILALLLIDANAQTTCAEFMTTIKKGYGATYSSYSSNAISKVTFYEKTIDYNNYYFAIVCFKKEYSSCTEYMYQVSSNTKFNYSLNYMNSAGKAFWKYIHPHNKNLECAPDFE